MSKPKASYADKMRPPYATIVDVLLGSNPELILTYIAHKLARRPDRAALWAGLDFEYRQEVRRLELQRRIDAGEGKRV